MAGQFNFVSHGAKIGEALQQMMVDREVSRRQAVLEAQQAEELKLRQAADARAATAQADALKGTELQRKATEALLARNERADMTTQMSDMAGQELTPDVADKAKKLVPGMIKITPETTTMSQDLPAVMGGAPVPGNVAPEMTTPESAKSIGTRRQQLLAEFRTRPDLTEDQKTALALIDASGDDNIPASLAGMLSTEDKQDVLLYRTKSGKLAYDLDGTKPFTDPKLPKHYKIVNEPNPASAGMPYSPFMVYTGSGIEALITDKRDGTIRRERIGDLNPGEGADKDISNALGVGQTIDRISAEFTPDKVGVLMGRLKNLDQKLWGSDPEYAKFKQNLTVLGNTIIQLRTGAQMSIQETQRILDEIAKETLPPTTFAARLKELEHQYDQYLANRTKVAYGRVTKEDITGMTEGRRPGEAAPGTETPAPETPAKPRKKFNPATGKVE